MHTPSDVGALLVDADQDLVKAWALRFFGSGLWKFRDSVQVFTYRFEGVEGCRVHARRLRHTMRTSERLGGSGFRGS